MDSRRVALFAATLVLASCSIDAVLEGPQPPDTRLSIAVQTTAVSARQGDTASLAASITRLGDFHGPVEFSLTEVPRDVTAEVGPLTTFGPVTRTIITFRVGASVPAGTYPITVHGSAKPDGATVTTVELRVTPRPAVAITLGQSALTIIKGGIAPLSVSLVRTAFTEPVAVALVGPTGITASVTPDTGAPGTIAGATGGLTIAVAPDVAAGTYNVVLRASAAGISNSDAPLAIVVSADALQVIVGNTAAPQASIVTADVIVNRNGANADVTFSVDGLPAGITSTFSGGKAASTLATMKLAVAASVAPGTYNLAVRGRSAGVADAVAPFVLTVGASNVALTLVPSTVTLLQGSTAASTLTLIRSAYSGSVGVELLDVPAGIRVTATEASVTGTTTMLVVTTDTALAPGTYTVTVRAVPAPIDGAGSPALDPVTSTLTITVVAAPSGDGNVVLDWSKCVAPSWVAAQDGSGPWVPLAGTQGLFRFGVTERGGFAYVSGDSGLTVRYGTAAELTAAWIDLCPPPPPVTHIVSGTALHESFPGFPYTNLVEQFTWLLGGGVGVSTFAAPNFAIVGVPPGPHDLIGWGGSLSGGARAYLRRDVPESATIGTVNLNDPSDSFLRAGVIVTIPGFVDESLVRSVALLMRSTCEVDVLPEATVPFDFSGSYVGTIEGIPADRLRANEFHRIDVTAIGTGGVRTLSYTSHALPSRTPSLPPLVTLTVDALTGSYTRLRASVGDIPPAYNGTMTFSYHTAGHVATVSASTEYLGSGAVQFAMPELGGVGGFPVAAAAPRGATGTWSLTLDGSNNQPMCSEGSARWTNTRKGTF